MTTENDSTPSNLASLDSLSDYLKQSPTSPDSTTGTTPNSIVPEISTPPKDSKSILLEIEAKMKMVETGGKIAERLFGIGERVVDKIIQAKKLEFIANQPVPAVQSDAVQQTQQSLNSEGIYDGLVQLLQFFLSHQPDLNVKELLKECVDNKEVAINMIDKYMNQNPTPQLTQSKEETPENGN